MASYFRQVPNFAYINRDKNDRNLSDYTIVKNIFKRGKIRDDIFKNVTYFQKYQIVGDERPDNVAFNIYEDETLDWVVLLSNNILDVKTEWPLSQNAFDRYVVNKYGDYDLLYNGIHHWETTEIKDSNGSIIIPAGLRVEEDFNIQYYDQNQYKDAKNFAVPVTYYEYEIELENKKRNIFVLKPIYLSVIFDDIAEFMPYKKGGDQYVSPTLKKGDNIRLFG